VTIDPARDPSAESVATLEAPPLLMAQEVVKQFGGLIAVGGVTL
jgi:hypothetical protein